MVIMFGRWPSDRRFPTGMVQRGNLPVLQLDTGFLFHGARRRTWRGFQNTLFGSDRVKTWTGNYSLYN